jgi:hypothetical protein
VGQLSETRLGPLLRYHPHRFDHMDYVNDADLPPWRGATRSQLCPGGKLFSWAWRDIRMRGGSLSRAWPWRWPPTTTRALHHAQHADGDVAGLHAHEDVAGGGDCGGTVNGAWALRLAGCKGSVEAGKDADLAVFDVSDYREIPYWFGAIVAR